MTEVDVLVAGGGPSGLIAATAAARLGATTLLIEREGFLGGNATAGMVAHFHAFFRKDSQIVRGIPAEFLERIRTAGGSNGFTKYLMGEARITGDPQPVYAFPFNTEIAKIAADELVADAGARILFHAQIVNTLTEGRRVTGVVIETVSGRREIRAKAVVDGTGDAVVAKQAGAEVAGDKDDSPKDRMPVTLVFRLTDVDLPRFRALPREEKQRIVREGLTKGEIPWQSLGFFGDPSSADAYCLMSRISGLDVLNDEDLSKAEMIGRQQVKSIIDFLRRDVPGFEKCKLAAIATRVGIRETRRIVGAYTLTEEDVFEGHDFEDGVVLGRDYIDVHHNTGTGILLQPLDKPFRIPLRCLLPSSVEGLVVTGRAISTTPIANGAIRAGGTVMALGQAAGTLAAVAARKGIAPRNVSPAEVQHILRENGAVVTEEDIDQ